MSRYSRAALTWVAAVSLAAVGLTIVHVPAAPRVDLAALSALAFLASCAAVAHVFPIRSSSDGASYRLTNVFVLAGAIALPPALLGPLVILAISPESVLHRRAGVWIRWTYNASQTTIAAHAAGAIATSIRAAALPLDGRLAAVLAMAAAAVVFTLLQALLVGSVISLNSRVPITRADTLTATALLGESFIAIQGVLVAGIAFTSPELLVFLPPILLLAHRLTRTAHLAQLAHIDGKTGLHNSRYFEHALEEELAHGRRFRRPVAVLLADLDHFKRVNDFHGHAAGDRVLREIADILRTALRKGDIVARFGGEEFVVMLPGTDDAEAAYLAERLRSMVAAHSIDLESGAELRCTISVGVASFPDHAADVASLVKQADGAMYRAKRTRNAVACAEAAPPVPHRLRLATAGQH